MSSFMVLLAVFKLWLHRQTAQDDLIVGVPIAGRNQKEIEATFGCFLNTLALRSRIAPRATFADLLAEVRATTLAAYDNQDVPFELLLAELQPERDTSRPPLFQVMFNMLPEENASLNLPGLRCELLPLPETGSKFDLTFYVETLSDALRFTVVYNKALFTAVRIQEMLTQFELLLKQVLVDPGQPLWGYSLVTPKTAVLLPNPQTPLPVEAQASLRAQFARQAAHFPQKTAVVDQFGPVSYQLLQQRSYQLAHQLLADGLQKEEVVAIYGHRSAGLVWAVLGVLHAGAAFLILDPAYPAARLEKQLEIAQIKGWLQLDAAGALPESLEACLDAAPLRSRLLLPTHLNAPGDPLAQQPTTDPAMPFAPDALSYLAFTSGTTGQPKAVMGTERPLVHFIQWYSDTFGLTADDHFSMLSGLAHDPLLRDLLTPLLLGATLHIPNLNQLAPGELATWLAQQAITVMHLTPAMAQALTTGINVTQQIPTLRYAVFGGEPLTRRHLAKLKNLAAQATFVNFYGATETPQAMGYYVVSREDGVLPPPEVVPLGRGIADTQLLLLNPNGRLAGVGELAEIYIRTPYLAKGYLTMGENGRFLPNPFLSAANDRLYRTGDHARYLPNGDVVFAGRQDRQVKIRGYRIELAEIEHLLIGHPNVADAYVKIYHVGSGPDEAQLVAYLIPKNEAELNFLEIRSYLGRQLPQYMVPAAFVRLTALPLTANGKLNTAVLPEPSQTTHDNVPNTLPQTATETQILKIWQRVLRVEQSGIHDNFFDLGGHSLLAIQLFTKIEAACRVKLPIGTIFQFPTVAQLAQVIDQKQSPKTRSTLVPMQPTGTEPPLFFVHGGAGHIFMFDQLAVQFAPRRPFYAFQPVDWDGAHLHPPDVAEMAARYVQEMRQMQPQGPYAVGGFCFGGTIAMEMAWQLEQAGEAVTEVVLIEPGPPAMHQANKLPRLHRKQPAADAENLLSSRTVLGEVRWILIRPWIKLRNDAKGWRRSWQAYWVRLLLAFNRPLPQQLSDTYYLHFVSRKSWDNYEAKPINGRVRLFLHHNRSQTDPRWRWLALASPDSAYHILPTDHFGILELPHVAEVAQIIQAHTPPN
jgi:amino acid adenylation domain-containing protein